MHDRRDPELAALIRRAARTPGDRGRWLELLLARCWPGGADRSEPSARPWVRAWGPVRVEACPPACGCGTGRCTVCN